MYSAIKIGGQKLYDLARKGKEVERKARKITIFELELVEMLSPREIKLRILCSKGTYIRTLCHDIGAALGCGGCMAQLRRTEASGFSIAEAVTMEQAVDEGEALLKPLAEYFRDYPIFTLQNEAQEKRAKNGNPLYAEGVADGTYRVYGTDGTFYSLSSAKDGELRSIKNFF